ncbi:MAG: ATP-dependent helicase [Nitrospirae bacterium]|nr:ATP-dependent helicase [Nitrospirota bacterium]
MTHTPRADGTAALLAELNAEQAEAARTTQGPLLVIAGAGTGKTRTLIYRTAVLVDQGIAPERILLLTFTRRAAEEMRQRAGLLLDTRCDRVSGGTFHATCAGLLRRFGGAVGLDPAFTIMDRADAEEVVGYVRAELNLGDRSRRFPKKKALLDILSKAVNRDVAVADTVAEEYPHFLEYVGDIERVAGAYREQKRRRQLVDYDDLLTLTVQLLERHPHERERVGALFSHIMVDEYQDTNRLQARLVRLLANGHDNVMAVGDDAQSIYRFRGACFRNIMDFPREFPGTRLVKLTRNYRSTPEVLHLANRVIAGARERYEKDLTSTCGPGDVPALICAPTENMQSRFVCQRILELHEAGVPLHEVAVLFRSAYHTFDLEVELARHHLPFTKRGGLKFMETAHVKDVVAYLRVLGNPHDAISWGRVLRLHAGIGEVTAQKIFGHLEDRADPWAALLAMPAPWTERLRPLGEVLAPLARSQKPPADMAAAVIEYYTPQLKAQFDDYPKRIKDLDQVVAVAERYAALEPFLTDLALEPPEASVAGTEAEGRDDHLILSTIHSAKGLEWQAVFVIWAVDGRFPSAYAEGSDEELDEERRLMYVALTRAKRHLTITYPINVYDRATGMVLSKPSRFVAGLPAEVLEPWALADDAGPARAGGTAGRAAGADDEWGEYFNQDGGW